MLPTVSLRLAAVMFVQEVVNSTSRSLTGLLASTLSRLIGGLLLAGSMVESLIGLRVTTVPPPDPVVALAEVLWADSLPAASRAVTV